VARRLGPAIFLAACLIAPIDAAPGSTSARRGECAGQRNAVVIDADAHRLWLCLGESVEREFTVALGQGGLGKRTTGDKRTPLGSYALGEPRASADFSLFIPVGYPTAQQRQAGFTGSDIGIHGPKKGWSWLGRITTWSDWTRGCIAVGHPQEIAEIAAWVKRHGTSLVTILGTPKP